MPKILILDIETSPILAHVWSIWQENIGLNQIVKDWHILSFSAKWYKEKEIFYFDQRNEKNIEDDKTLLKKLSTLINQADVIVGHNLDKFDIKKINARLILNELQPLIEPKQVDTLKLAKKKFAFTSNRLEYLTNKLCTKYKKSSHKKFTGFELWTGCLKGDIKAWKEMEKYNKLDVLSLEELYTKLSVFVDPIRHENYRDSINKDKCDCGSHLQKWGHYVTTKGKFTKLRCPDCGRVYKGTENLLSKEKRKNDIKRV
jgi:DNA polymerase elongation subunit (family B)